MLKAIFFDLDGTLLPMDENEFIKVYSSLIYKKVAHLGYDKEKLINTLFIGLEKMYKNDGTKTNETVFWDVFKDQFGEERLKDKAIFNEFYLNEFKGIKVVCKENPLAREIIDFVKANLQYCILSTNPIFPKVATLTRMSFVNLKEDDFDFITTYENSSYAKPNPKYFEFLLEKFNLKKDEVIVFGNNDYEDYLCAEKAGINCYIINNTPIFHKEKNISCPIIKMEDVIDTIKKEIIRRK